MWGNILKAIGQAMVEQMSQSVQQQQSFLAAQQEQFAQRQFVASLFTGEEATAIARLRVHVLALGDEPFAVFQQTVQAMLVEAQQNLAQVQASGGDTAWGTSFEDRMALGMAQLRTGNYGASQQLIQQAQQVVQGLARVQQLAAQFRAERLASLHPEPARGTVGDERRALAEASGQRRNERAAAGRAAAAPPAAKTRKGGDAPVRAPSRAAVASAAEARIEAMLDELMATGQMPDGLMPALQAIDDPAVMERLMAKLKEAGADQLGDRPLDNIADYYREGEGLYEPLWPITARLPLPFEELDRPTRFHVLFAECKRRLAEGSAARNAGRLDEADQIFRECLERADQIDVPILKADAFEGLLTVAEKRGDRPTARRYLKLAEAQRALQAQRR
jgi:tetratricopeptide (TPR) repeat protein